MKKSRMEGFVVFWQKEVGENKKELRSGEKKTVLLIIHVIFQNNPQCLKYMRWSNTNATGRILQH